MENKAGEALRAPGAPATAHLFSALFLGRLGLLPGQVVGAFRDQGGPRLRNLVLKVQLPRAVAAARVGADLAVAGAALAMVRRWASQGADLRRRTCCRRSRLFVSRNRGRRAFGTRAL